MSRSIEDIDRDIAQVKAEIALRNKYEQGFNQPQTRVGWSSYIAAGDPNVMKMYQDRENAYKNMMKQQEFQAEQNDLNRKNAEKLANMSRGSNTNTPESYRRLQLDADLAQDEYDKAVKEVDKSKPETVLAAKKAARKLNFANSLLPYFDKETDLVSTEFNEDAPEILRRKKINSLKATMDAKNKLKPENWSDDDKIEYQEAYEALAELDPDSAKDYAVSLENKGDTEEQRNAKAAARDAKIKNAASGTYSFTDVMKKIEELSQKYTDRKFEEQDEGSGKYTIKVSKK
jgi:hypothetical protein